MSKILILFATQKEANATIHALQAHLINQGETPPLYAFEGGWVVLSGMGIPHAQMAIAKYAHLVDEVWNFGLAGCLQGEYPIGRVLSIHAVGKYIPVELDPGSEQISNRANPILFLDSPGARLISSDFPVHSKPRDRLRTWDLVDMEGYGVAFAAHYFGKRSRIWKIVSDFSSPGGRELIEQHIAKLSETLATTALLALNTNKS